MRDIRVACHCDHANKLESFLIRRTMMDLQLPAHYKFFIADPAMEDYSLLIQRFEVDLALIIVVYLVYLNEEVNYVYVLIFYTVRINTLCYHVPLMSI